MYAKFFVVALFASAASFAAASPNPVPSPAPTPAPEEELHARVNINGIINSVTDIAGSVVTGPGGSVFTQATSVVGSVVSRVTNAVAGAGGSVFTEVTSAGGRAFTVVTSEGGQALTLAESGIPTSAFGSIYTVATAAILPSTSSNAATGIHTAALASPAIVGLVTILGSALFGAMVTL